MLTRKHFTLIAATINDLDIADEALRRRIAERFAGALRWGGDNPNFDSTRFVDACLACRNPWHDSAPAHARGKVRCPECPEGGK